MENETIQNPVGDSELKITHEAIFFLSSSAKWAKFLAIVGFVFIGLLVVIAILAGTVLATMGGTYGIGGGVVTIVYLIIAAISFIPTFLLFKFATKLQTAIRTNDTPTLTESFNYMNKYYLFSGVLTIIGLAFIALAIVFGIIGGIMSTF